MRDEEVNHQSNSSKSVVFWMIGIAALVVIGLALGALILGMTSAPANAPATDETTTQAPGTTQTPNTSECSDQTADSAVTITYTTEEEFSPSCVKVAAGTTLTYENKSSSELEVGADPHPVHTGNKELSDGEFVLSVQPGGSETAVVNEVGTFGLHNHLNSSSKATVIVE